MNDKKGIEPIIRVFCDFDGTITRKDSGDDFFRTFPHSSQRIPI